jgi:hypothetical protein
VWTIFTPDVSASVSAAVAAPVTPVKVRKAINENFKLRMVCSAGKYIWEQRALSVRIKLALTTKVITTWTTQAINPGR